jgi:hypothetical protein
LLLAALYHYLQIPSSQQPLPHYPYCVFLYRRHQLKQTLLPFLVELT